MIRFLLNLYIFIIIIDSILSFMPQYKNHEYVKFVKSLANYSLNPIRKILPRDLPFDFSPLVVIILIRMIIVLF